MEKEDVSGVGGAPANVHRLGEPEILRQPDELDLGKFGVPLRAAIAGTVVDDDDLQGLPALRRFQGFQAAPEKRAAIMRNHHAETRGAGFSRLACCAGVNSIA